LLDAVDPDRAAIGGERAREDLDQGGLAGAVVADQAVHLARVDLEVCPVERSYRAVGLDEVAHLDQRGAGAGRVGGAALGIGHAGPQSLKRRRTTWNANASPRW